jgi:ABC-2 type transport system ATP-binding protein
MIRINNLKKSYGSNEVLKGIDLAIDSGMCVGIVGENGAGKSTLFNCLTGIEQYSGEITSEVNPLKNHTGFLQTNPFFLNKITGREYLQLLCNARGIDQQEFDSQNVFALPLDQYASTYSTGMKKKLALLAILLQKNEFFILDEPYNGVDYQSSILISEIVTRLKAANKAILISSHIFATLKETCDLIYVLKNGELSDVYTSKDFDTLENEMKHYTIGTNLDHLTF